MTTSKCPVSSLVENFDFSDPRVRADPQAVWAELRKGPPAWSDNHGGHWVVSRYADVVQVVEHPELYTSTQGTPFPPTGFPYPLPPSEADPPEHAKYRRMAAPFFTSRALSRLETSIRAVTRERLRSFVETGKADLAKDLAVHVPANVIAEMMGFPQSDAGWFVEITDRMLYTAERPELAEENAAIGGELVGYLMKHLQARKTEPQDDLLTDLVQSTMDGRPLTPEEELGLAFFFLIAGHETTVGGVTYLLYRLGLNPDQRDALIADRTLLRGAIEEGLRIDSPVLHLSRVATQDTELGGARIQAGDRVVVIYASANLDAAAFTDPDTFDIRRERNRHVAFSTGIHKCQGAGLARLEMSIVVDEVLGAIPDYVVDTGGVTFRNVQGVRSVATLPVTFTPGKAADIP
ncbi:cytochrome P450 [Sporichthya polymorpha]|uniref:cytochrome P450 n=1 Tax=Sporichthya polymorpha TaxID=35751 RepID=UPI000369386B|nr:cytochrome P450 [Sporichthya polymorpha]